MESYLYSSTVGCVSEWVTPLSFKVADTDSLTFFSCSGSVATGLIF